MNCPKCGTQVADDAVFCPNCGAKIEAGEPQNNQNTVYQGYMAKPTLEVKNVALNIVLCIVTCDIYSLIWLYNLIDDTKKVCGETDGTVGEFLLCALVPFYSVYWFYSREKRISEAGARYGLSIEDKSIIMLVLCLFGLGFVNIALMQDDFNKYFGA